MIKKDIDKDKQYLDEQAEIRNKMYTYFHKKHTIKKFKNRPITDCVPFMDYMATAYLDGKVSEKTINTFMCCLLNIYLLVREPDISHTYSSLSVLHSMRVMFLERLGVAMLKAERQSITDDTGKCLIGFETDKKANSLLDDPMGLNFYPYPYNPFNK